MGGLVILSGVAIWSIAARVDREETSEKKNDSTPLIREQSTVRKTELPVVQQTILQKVPFTSQAPSRQWDDPVFQNGCEEASILMARAWLKREALPSREVVEQKISALSALAEELFGDQALDTSVDDTATLLREYLHMPYAVYVQHTISLTDLIRAIEDGHLVILPVDGRTLANPYYTAPGPERHMLVVSGYNPKTKEFITNDPGTRRGKEWRYGEEKLFDAIRDYPTGHDIPVTGRAKAMIILHR